MAAALASSSPPHVAVADVEKPSLRPRGNTESRDQDGRTSEMAKHANAADMEVT